MADASSTAVISTAVAAAGGVVVGALIAAVFNFYSHRENLAQRSGEHRESLEQRSREHLVSQAYETATSEWKAGLESFTKIYPGGGFIATPLSGYLIYHLTLAQLLIDRQGVERLDEKSITHALDEARRLSLAQRKADGVAGNVDK